MTPSSASTLVFLGAKRTPFGAFGGTLKDVNLSDLGASCTKAALAQSGVSAEEIQHVVIGNVLQSSVDSIYVARHVGLKAGVPIAVPSLAVNRLCGSGFQAIVDAQLQMCGGDTEVALVGGVENMSMTPYMLRGVRWGSKMGNMQTEDYLFAALVDSYCGLPMAITAENLAVKHGITREQVDRLALSSQARAKAASEKGFFKTEISPISVAARKETVTVEADEHPKPATTMETLAKLKPVFKKDGVVTAGNASGIVDGAAAMVVATEAYAARKNLKPLGRLVAYGVAGVDPSIMGIGPVPASQAALRKAGMKMSDMDLVEVNEAFAAQYLAVEKELGLDRERTNVNGGAIAIGHPLAASGTRIVMHLLYELQRRGKRYGLGSACIGGGQGIAVIVEAY